MEHIRKPNDLCGGLKMVKSRVVKDESGTVDLLETYSDENYKLKQVETNIVYGSSVIDVIAGYDESNIPFSRYTYTETDEKDDPEIDEI